MLNVSVEFSFWKIQLNRQKIINAAAMGTQDDVR
jgi:hypothetical protein